MKRGLLLILSLLLCLCSCREQTEPTTPEPDQAAGVEPVVTKDYTASTPENVKGIWLSQWDMQRVYLDGGKQREETDFRIRAARIMNDAVQDGFNTVFLQIRPFGDSFYPSKIYPASEMVVGEYGRDFSYDPLSILVEAAHAAGLSLHAWINPLRLMTTEDLEKVSADFSVRRWYDDAALRGRYLVLQGDGRWYLNPGYREVRDLILEGAREILQTYEVDGLHLDDYFYPTTSTDYDAECFQSYQTGGGELDLGDFRRMAITTLVSELYAAVHELCPGALFGVSPGGNPDRVFSSEYADVYKWCESTGYLDYNCPQVYYGFEHENYPFDKTADRWADIVKCDSVKLFYGLSFHKASAGFDQYAGSGAYEWAQHSDILFRSLEYVSKIERCGGVCVFSYQYFRNALTGAVPDYPASEREAFLPLWKQVIFPAAG